MNVGLGNNGIGHCNGDDDGDDDGVARLEQTPALQLKKQRSMKSSLCTSKTPPDATTSRSPSLVPSLLPRLPPLPNSLPGPTCQELYQDDGHAQRSSTAHHPEPYHEYAPPSTAHQRRSTAPKLRTQGEGLRSLSAERATSPEPHTIVENFSRPRQSSDPSRSGSCASLSHTVSAVPHITHNAEKLQRHHDLLREQDSSAFPSRTRHLPGAGGRSSRGFPRPDSNHSSFKREPISRPAGNDEDQVRASFRSALTTESSYITSGTERSSVMAESSPATSIFEKDEGMSVDDAIEMYEVGFNDSKTDDNFESRPDTAYSQSRRISQLREAMNEKLPTPETNVDIRGLDAKLDLNAKGTRTFGIGGALDFQDSRAAQLPTINSGALPAASEFDSTRDRYGFHKKSQHITSAQYDAWNGHYKEHLSRRRKKWLALMREHGLSSENPIQFPPPSTKVKRFVRKGIPPDWRGNAWFFYSGGPLLLAHHRGLYKALVQRAATGGVHEIDVEIIERDLNRTFPDNIKFKPDLPDSAHDNTRFTQESMPHPETPLLQALRRVLQTFSIHNPRIGYCQSLNFLAGLLLLFMNEEKAFWMLNMITSKYLPNTHEVNLEGANVDLGVLMTSIKDSMPAIWAKIGGELDGSAGAHKASMHLPPITLCTTAWFMSCFIGTLPIETTLRVWDCFFYEGSKTLFRIALAVFKLGEQEIRAVSDPMEIFQVVQTIPRRMIDANTLLETCFKRRNGFGHLSQETIDQRRAERRANYAEQRKGVDSEPVPLKKKQLSFIDKISRGKIK